MSRTAHSRVRPGGPRSWRRALRFAATSTGVAIATMAAGCTNPNDGQPKAVFVTTTVTTRAPSASDQSPTTKTDGPLLGGVCPNPLIVQLDGPLDLWALPWTAMTAIDGVGTGSAYNAEMVDPITRTPTGIRLELRQTLPVGRSVSQVLRDDLSVHLGVVSTDVSLDQRSQSPVSYLAAPWLQDDRILHWNSNVNPGAISLADLTTDPAVTLSGTVDDPVVAYLIGSSLIARTQVVSGPGVVQFDNFLNDPTGWLANTANRNWQFLAETGWSPYPKAVVSGNVSLALNKRCFEAFVPVLQRAVVELRREPERMVANLAEIAARNGIAIDQTVTMAKLRAAIDNGLLNMVDGKTVAEVTAARMEQALRADITSRRTRGLSTGSSSKLRQQVKSMIADFTATDLELPPA